MATTTPFDVKQLEKATDTAGFSPPDPIFVTATDGIELAVRVYEPAKTARAILLFYHGGGAHSAAGYQLLANQLASQYNIKVYTPDLRGHGQSKGPRGDAPSPDQVYRDVDAVLEYIVSDNNNKDLPIFCGGHSSGAGLMMQYATAYKPKSQDTSKVGNIAGYLLLSPQLGPSANVARDGPGFAKVSILPFVLNGIFGIMGNYPAVQFQYSQHEITKGGVVAYNTINMANAISPTQAQQQLNDMEAAASSIHLWMGAEDELFDAKKVQTLYPPTTIVKKATHLGILVQAGKLLGPWILQQLQEKQRE